MRNWAGNITYASAAHAEPASIEELQELVARSPRVKALGSRHSFSTVADTDGISIGTRGLGIAPALDGPDGVVVAAGATYAEVGAFLQAHGRALANLGSLPHISVAGAVSTGTHGSGVANACLATAVTAVETVRADGSLVRVDGADPDFGGTVLSLGALGVTTRLWLRTEPTYDVAQRVVVDVPSARVVEHAVEMLSSAYSVSVFSAFDTDRAAIWSKQRDGVGAGSETTWGGLAATGEEHPIRGIDPAATTAQQGLAGPWLDRLPHFRIDHVPSAGEELQTELMVPLERAGEAFEVLRGLADRLAPVLLTHELRAVAADTLWLSPFRDRASAAVHFTWIADLERVRPVLEQVEDRLAALGGRPHWGKVVSDPARWSVDRDDPGVASFRALAGRLDPERRFVNSYLVERGLLEA